MNLEWAYIAGLFDGEGSVGVYPAKNGRKTLSGDKKYWAVKLAIYGTYRPVFAKLQEQLGYGTLTTQKRQKLAKTPSRCYDTKLCRQGWKWILTNRPKIESFLKEVFPFLHEKQSQVQIVFDFIDGKISGEEAYKLCKKEKSREFTGGEIHWRSDTKGENNPMSKFNNEDIVRIRGRYERGETAVRIAKDYGVGATTIRNIVHRHTWKHVE